MVFKSVTLLARSRGPDEFWRKTKIFKLSAVILKIYLLNIFINNENFSITGAEDVIATVIQSEEFIEH